MSTCTQCSVVSQALATEGTLVLAGVPHGSIEALGLALLPYGIEIGSPADDLWAVELFDGAFPIVLDWARLNSDEVVAEAQYVVLSPGEALSLSHMGKMRPLQTLVKRLKNAWVLEMIRENRFTNHYQPIFEVADTDHIHAHECLMRGIGLEGETIYPGAILDAADEEGMVFHLDRLGRINAIKGFAAQRVPGKAFINFNPVSVYNPLACLATTVAAAKASGLAPDQIVFELIERNHVANESHLLRIVDFYRAAGYLVALDDVGAGYSSLNLLSSLKPDYMKIDMNLIRGIDKDPVRQSIAGNLLEMGRKLNILSVVEGVETAEEFEFVRREGADLVQGYLFGRPAESARRMPLYAAI